MQCARCRHTNPPGSKFCNECGSRLQTPPTPSDRIHTLIPADFAARLETARTERAMLGERRIVTMLFCDVQGSTAAASRLDPEDWAQIINEAFDYMIRPVYAYEGTVARLMGDAILAFFGAPVAHEDDPQRAVLAGLGIIDGFQPCKERILEEWGLSLDVRVGINTGLVMVGAVGSDLRMEYTALGDAINLAARMEQTAEPGTVQVAEETYRLVHPLFDWEALGEIQVKGKEGPLQTYRPLRIRPTPGKTRGIEGLDSPLVGRKDELDQLTTAVSRLAEDQGSIAFITGEAGLGKSRLIRELKTGARDQEIRWYEVASLSYETSQPYSVFQRLLRRVYGIQEGDTPAEIWEKFLPILDQIPPDVGDRGRLFEALFAVHGQSGGLQPEGATFKRQLFDLMSRLVATWTKAGPQVIVLEDLHWADPASIELLLHLLPIFTGQPTLLIWAMRPERTTPAWEAMETASESIRSHVIDVSLSPLTPADTVKLVDRLLTVKDLPLRLRARILEKTEGNPFFIEEVVRTLIDTGALARVEGGDGVRWQVRADSGDLEIPGNLQTLLTARIDLLGEEPRRTLQLASVIGRTFFSRVLETIGKDIWGDRFNLDQHLARLQQADMVLQSANSPEPEYMFRHALTQEAAYHTILLRQRREYHRLAAEAMETLFEDRLEEFHPVLAHHFYEARDPRVLVYGTMAGDAAFRVYAIPEALRHYSRMLDYLRQTGFGDGDTPGETIQHIFLRRGRCLELLADYLAAHENYIEMQQWAEQSGSRSALLATLIAQATALSVPNPIQDPAAAQKIAENALALAADLGDKAAEARIYWVFMLIRMYGGDMPGGVEFGERSVRLARELELTDLLAHVLQDLGLVYMSIGRIGDSDAVMTEARPLWESLQNLPMLAENYANTAYLRTVSFKFEEAFAMADRSYQIGQFIENDWAKANAHVFIGLAHVAIGNVDALLKYSEEIIELAARIGHPGRIILIFQLSWLYKELGEMERSRAMADRALAAARNFPPFEPLSLAMSAWHAARLGHFERAEELLASATGTVRRKTLFLIDLVVDYAEAAFEYFRGEGTRAQAILDRLFEKISGTDDNYFFSDACYLQALIHKDAGRPDQARAVLESGRRRLQGTGAHLKLWKMYAALGMTAEARSAAAIISAHISDPQLKAAFEAHQKQQEVV